MSQTLYRKWRPQTFAEVRGQERVTRTLVNALAGGRVGHAYLFCGPRGVGKTTTARLLAKAVNCLHDHDTGPDGSHPVEPDNTCSICRQIIDGRCLDVIEIDAASSGRVDDARDLRDQINFAPNEAKHKFYIIDEAHQITKDAFDALLKTFEEPPEHVIFVLATTDPNKVPPTILSRCQRFDFRRLSVADLRAGLSDICAAEQVTAEPGALDLLARAAEGSSRDSLSLLDQAIAFCGRDITEQLVRVMLGLASAETIDRLAEALLARDAKAGLSIINEAVDAGVDPRGLNRELIEHLRYLLLLKVNSATAETIDAPREELELLRQEMSETGTDTLIRQLKVLSEADYGFRNAPQAQLPLEIAFLESIALADVGTSAAGRTLARDSGRGQGEGQKGAAGQPPVRPEPQVRSAVPRGIKEALAPPITDPSAQPADQSAWATEEAEQREGTPAHMAPTSKEPALAADERAVVIGPSAADEEFHALVAKWSRVLEIVREQNRNVEAVLRSCPPESLEGATLTLMCAAQFHARTLEQPDKKRLLEGAISRVAGRPCYVKCVVREKKARAAEPSGEAQRPPEDDPLVRAALRMLNARVLE